MAKIQCGVKPDIFKYSIQSGPRLRCDHLVGLLQLVSPASPAEHAGISHHSCRGESIAVATVPDDMNTSPGL